MKSKLASAILLLLLALPADIYSQAKSVFTGDASLFSRELTTFMGPNLKAEQTDILKGFISKWDNSAFRVENMSAIMDIASLLASRSMRATPHFLNFINAINYFNTYNIDEKSFTNWLAGVSEISFNRRNSNDFLDRYFRNTILMLSSNILNDSGTIKWKVKNNKFEFRHDTTFYLVIKNATLTCISQHDSTEIYGATGIYIPEYQIFKGVSGKITWEKAGYPADKVYAELGKYTVSTNKVNFTIDSVKFSNPDWFKQPVYGKLSDQAIVYSNKEKATWPRFDAYATHFVINNIYKGINYEGGLSFEGSSVKGIGESFNPAVIRLFRHDSLFMRLNSTEFLFSKSGISSQSVVASVYIGADSIFHSNIGFSFLASNRQINLFRTTNPISNSPYYDSYHSLDMTFEYLSCNLEEPRIIMSRTKGAALGQARFESFSFFNSDYFLQLMGLDDYHPLGRLVKFAETYYSETFPVAEFAKWLKKSVESVTGMCIDLANRGFIFYDRSTNEITIKQKTKDFLAFYSKKKDYDALNIVSETRAPLDNAVLDLKNLKLTLNGVKGVMLSDSQNVAIFPYEGKLVIGRDRDMEFDGVVRAGLFTVFGRNFSFSYDSFRIKLTDVDSIRIAVETGRFDTYGNAYLHDISNLIQSGTADLFIDNPGNKSGLKKYPNFPIINVTSNTFIFYDKIAGLDDVYKKKDFYFRMDPFSYNNIDHIKKDAIKLPGEFVGGNILRPMKQSLTVQPNYSLGFDIIVPPEGLQIYEGKAVVFDSLKMNDKGLTGGGTLKYLTATAKSDYYRFFPDSMLATASDFTVAKDAKGLFPVLDGQDVNIKWLTGKDEWLASNRKGKRFNIFDNGTNLDGQIALSPSGMKGKGVVNMTDAKITSSYLHFTAANIKADTALYSVKSPGSELYAFTAENVKADIDFAAKKSDFSRNTDSSFVRFPDIQYISKMSDFSYDHEKKILNMLEKGTKGQKLMSSENLLKVSLKSLEKPTMLSANTLRDTVSFRATSGTYNLNNGLIEAENVNYIRIADALIQPGEGKITINRKASIQPIQGALIAVNNRHILHDGKITIESSKRYSGSALYDYIADDKTVQQINFQAITCDTLTTTALGQIPKGQGFKLSQAFSFSGDVVLSGGRDLLTYNGAAAVDQRCAGINSQNIRFKADIDPENVMIPVGEKPRDLNDELIYSGSFMNTDSLQLYTGFLSPKRSYSDFPVVSASGWLYFDKKNNRFVISTPEKLADASLPGNMVTLDRNFCFLTGEGKLDFGARLDLVTLNSAGKVLQTVDSNKINIQALMALDFFFSDDALKIMAADIREMPTLKPVNITSEFYNKGMKDLLGVSAASQIRTDLDLFGSSKGLPKEFTYKILLNDVNLKWNEASSSFRSVGKIGIGFIGQQPVNVYVDGFIDIQKRRSGDMIDIYLKADNSLWFYFSYFRGVMMTQSSDMKYNSLIAALKLKDRKDPASSVRVPYTYMISSEDRLSKFLRRMAGEEFDE